MMKTMRFFVFAAMMGAILSGIDQTASAAGFRQKSSSSFSRNRSTSSQNNSSFNRNRSSASSSQSFRTRNIAPRTGLGAPAPRQIKPIDPGIGNGTVRPRPLPRPGTGAPAPRPIVRKPLPKPGTGAPAPRPIIKPRPKPGTGAPAPRPIVGKPLPKPGTGAPAPRPVIKPRPKPGTGAPAPRPIKPIDPGIGNGQPIVKPNPHGHHGHGHHHLWIGVKPHHCHWWFHYCPTIVTYSPTVYVPCSYNYVVCDYRLNGEVVFPNVKFRLGVTGLFLPEKGMGIEKVEENSPAELNGLKPGMIIAKCNGVLIDNEEAFTQVMKTSNGILDLEIVVSETEEPVELTIDLRSTYSQP